MRQGKMTHLMGGRMRGTKKIKIRLCELGGERARGREKEVDGER